MATFSLPEPLSSSNSYHIYPDYCVQRNFQNCFRNVDFVQHFILRSKILCDVCRRRHAPNPCYKINWMHSHSLLPGIYDTWICCKINCVIKFHFAALPHTHSHTFIRTLHLLHLTRRFKCIILYPLQQLLKTKVLRKHWICIWCVLYNWSTHSLSGSGLNWHTHTHTNTSNAPNAPEVKRRRAE